MGTRTNTTQSEPQFLTAISVEKSTGKTTIGIAFVDTSIGLIHIGQFDDDSNLSRLLRFSFY
jgi:DNA mismatch repair protein MSH6